MDQTSIDTAINQIESKLPHKFDADATQNFVTLEANNMSYFNLQLRLATYVFLFWSILILCTFYRYKIKQCRPDIVEVVIQRIQSMSQVRKCLEIKETFVDLYFQFDIRRIQSVIRRITWALSTIKNTILTTRPKYNLSQLINNIKSTMLNFQQISQSLRQIGVSILHGVKKVMQLPFQIKQAILILKKEISKFWNTIEQIVQIVRLPIEVLRAISNLVMNLAAFLSRLQRPKFKIG